MKTPKVPTYGLHKPTGQARCYVNGKTVYLGKYGSEESRIRFGEIVGRLIGGQSIDPIARTKSGSPTCAESSDPGPSVGEICLAFLRHAETHYVKNDKPTSQMHVLRSVVKPLNLLYGLTPASDFGPLALKAVRQRLIEQGWCRDVINRSMSRIRQIFKYAIENELIRDPAVLTRLQTVAPLLEGRTEAHDNAPRTSVSDADIDAVKAIVKPLVKDLIDLQRLTGARSGELLTLTTSNIKREGEVWTAEVSEHKTRHHGKSRVLYFGPQSQRLLLRYLNADPDLPLFLITQNGYRRAVTRACQKAKIERWVPHQLRHTAAETVRDTFGLEHAQSILGHAKANMTEHYAKAGQKRAAEVAKRIG